MREARQEQPEPALLEAGQARVSYTLRAAANVAFTLKRLAPGRKLDGRCVKPSKATGKDKRCRRLIAVRGQIISAGKAGANRFASNGKIGGHKPGAGTYQLTATPNGGGRQPVVFTLVA